MIFGRVLPYTKRSAERRMQRSNLWKSHLKSGRSRFSAITCRANAASPRSRPTCFQPWQRSIPQTECFAVPVNDIQDGYEYPDVVRFEIEEQDLSSYQRAADFLNISNVDIVCLQHEFGIFGGPAGSHLLALLRELRMPVVTTLHTVLREPNADQRRVMQELIARSTRLRGHGRTGTADVAGGFPGAAGQD